MSYARGEVASSSSGMADVGACHIVDAQRHARGFSVLAWYGKCRRHNTVDAQRHVGEPFSCLSSMGVDDAHNTIGKMSAPTTLLGFCHAREVVGYCPAGVHRTFLSIAVDLSALPYFLYPFPGPYRASVPGRLSALIAPVGEEL